MEIFHPKYRCFNLNTLLYLQWKMEMSALIGGDYLPNKYNLCILPFSIYCPAGAVALLPENEVKICSPPKINFLHFTRRTPTNVFPHNNNQPGNCFFFVTNYSSEICQIYLLWIMSEKHSARFSRIIFKIKKCLSNEIIMNQTTWQADWFSGCGVRHAW